VQASCLHIGFAGRKETTLPGLVEILSIPSHLGMLVEIEVFFNKTQQIKNIENLGSP
jgi:hypothetical protein